jgi:hypothetical protein
MLCLSHPMSSSAWPFSALQPKWTAHNHQIQSNPYFPLFQKIKEP